MDDIPSSISNCSPSLQVEFVWGLGDIRRKLRDLSAIHPSRRAWQDACRDLNDLPPQAHKIADVLRRVGELSLPLKYDDDIVWKLLRIRMQAKKLRQQLVEIDRGRRDRIPVVRYIPCISDSPSEFNGPVPPEWLALFVHSNIPSVWIEDHNASCSICCEDFQEPPLAELDELGLGDDGERGASQPVKTLRQLPCRHVFHVSPFI
ncbi:hypothetical protein D9758_007535 [Tetrapyrgos nigripes]|uniref:Uncharacterized protein n=1 Tax=Tetrapyrgos nigripes TaxID=182062 RepID=A0A8H5G3L5_9AGAR|nr:hypothetical protein D9758_007535 [Tetrapyrgos nigripes]